LASARWERGGAVVLIKELSIKGFKNLTDRVMFAELGRINVIHGENNVGKSNVLEAMHLLFELLELRLAEIEPKT
jgi:AAA15 family ATPase/GTPase